MNEIKKNIILRSFLELNGYEYDCPVFDPNSKNRSDLKVLTTSHVVTEIPSVVKTDGAIEYTKGVTVLCSGRYTLENNTLIDACANCPLHG